MLKSLSSVQVFDCRTKDKRHDISCLVRNKDEVGPFVNLLHNLLKGGVQRKKLMDSAASTGFLTQPMTVDAMYDEESMAFFLHAAILGYHKVKSDLLDKSMRKGIGELLSDLPDGGDPSWRGAKEGTVCNC